MKLWIPLLFLALPVAADVLPPRPATQAEAAAGVLTTPYISPATMASAVAGVGGVTNWAQSTADKYFAATGISDPVAKRQFVDACQALNDPASFPSLIDVIPIWQHLNPNGRSLFGNPYSIIGSNFPSAYEGLAGLSTNGIAFALPKTVTNYTVVFSVYCDAYAIDTFQYGQPAQADMFVLSLVDTNTGSGTYMGIEGRNNSPLFIREKVNNTWSLTTQPGVNTAGTYSRPNTTPGGATALVMDTTQHGSCYALSFDAGQNIYRGYWDTCPTVWGNGSFGSYTYTLGSALNTPRNMLYMGIDGSGSWITNNWDGTYFNTNLGYGGSLTFVAIYATTNTSCLAPSYKAFTLFDGRPRTYMTGTSIFDPTFNFLNGFGGPPFTYVIWQVIGLSTHFNNVYQTAFPGEVFQNKANAGGTISNELNNALCSPFYSAGWITNGAASIPAMSICDEQGNDWRNGSNTNSVNGWLTTLHKPEADWGAKTALLLDMMAWTNAVVAGSTPYQWNTNLAGGFDFASTNLNWFTYKWNMAQYVPNSLLNTNTGPIAYSADGIHPFGYLHTNLWNGFIGLIKANKWTGYGYSNTPTLYP